MDLLSSSIHQWNNSDGFALTVALHEKLRLNYSRPSRAMFGFALRCCDKEEIVKPSAPFLFVPDSSSSTEETLGEQTSEDGGK